MKLSTTKLLAAALVLIGPTAAAQDAQAAGPKDTLVITHAQIYAPGQPAADAVAISGTKIRALGKSSELAARCKPPCRTIDAQGGFAMPGFHDAHAHQASGGAGAFRVEVSGSYVPSIVSEVREYAQANPQVAWIQGRGWYAGGFGQKFPTRQDLDQAESKRPVVLIDSDGHQLWTNTAAIKAAGIDRNTKDPEGGKIVRDENGDPTGIFLENATDLIYDKVPDPTEEELIQYILKGQETGLRGGYTAFQGGPVGLATMRAYAKLDAEHKLKQRAFLWADLEASDEDFQKLVDFAHSLPKNGKVHITAFKGFVDGVISSYTGALLEPYADRPDTRGEPTITQEKLNQFVLRANRAGFPVALHSIGDRAVRMSLDAYENSKKILNHSLINRVEHIEVVDPADAPRFGALGVAASMQPTHMHFASAASSYYPTRLGPERLKHAFAWNEILSHGGMLLFGTDWPVVDEDPIEGMHCAVQRTYYDGTPFEPQQKLDGDTALQAYTWNPAKAVGLGDELGKIAPGYDADLVILDHDPRGGNSASLYEDAPRALIIAGENIPLDTIKTKSKRKK